MIEKSPLMPGRVRRITGSFAFIEHRFVRGRFWESLTHHELLLYFFLVLVGDRQGMSYYGFDKISTILGVSVDHYIAARDGLIEKDLIAFDGYLFQVLSLPDQVVSKPAEVLRPATAMEDKDPATIRQYILKSLRRNS